MKIKLLTSIVAAAVAIQGASAISVLNFQANVEGIPADVTFEGFSSGPQGPFALTGIPATLEYNNAVIVQASGTTSGAVPFPSTLTDDYLSVKAGGEATFKFTTTQGQIAFQWGSIDSYNTVSFFLGSTLVDSFTGTDVVTSPVAANGNQGLNGSAYVTFGGGAFDRMVLTSTTNSFEIDNVSVPDGGMTIALLGLGLSGLALARRRMSRK